MKGEADHLDASTCQEMLDFKKPSRQNKELFLYIHKDKKINPNNLILKVQLLDISGLASRTELTYNCFFF